MSACASDFLGWPIILTQGGGSGDITTISSNNIINLASNYTRGVSNITVIINNSFLTYSNFTQGNSNYTWNVSNTLYTSGTGVGTNVVERIAPEGTNVFDFSTSSQKYVTAVLTNVALDGTYTLRLTNILGGQPMSVYFVGGITNYQLKYLWPAGTFAKWVGGTNTLSRSNVATELVFKSWDSTNVTVAGREEL